MSGRRRRELADSFRLVASDEQWFARDLLVGVVAFALWVAGTGALATRAASALDRSLGLGAGEAPSAVAVAVFAVLWVVAPALVVATRLRRRLLNLRGNVEQYYRFDHPAALLAPPALLVLAVAVAGVALGSFPPAVALVMVPVGLFALVRTLAFSYRVYSFSHPRIVQALAALSTVLLLGSVIVASGMAAGRRTLVEQTFRAAGLPTWIIGTASVEGIAVSGLAVAATVPVLAALAYVLVQSVVALGVRLIEPEVDRSKMRTGQRYPPYLPAATSVQQSGASTAADGSAADTGGETASADETPEPASGPADGAAADETDAGEEDDLDDVSNTRVFTPPAEGDEGSIDAGPPAGGEATADSGATGGTGGETRAVPSGGDDGSTSNRREHCEACGESFTVDTTVRFCPNCGGAL